MDPVVGTCTISDAQRPHTYERFEPISATVIGTNRSGVCLLADTGEKLFAFGAADHRPGSRCMCGIKRLARPEERKDMQVVVEWVTYYPPIGCAA